MDEKHRKALQTNFVFLKKEIEDLEGVMDFLYQKNLLTEGMVQDIKAEKTQFNKNGAFLRIIPKRGPLAFDLLCQALVETHQGHIAQKINPELKFTGVTPVRPEVGSGDKSTGQPASNPQKNSNPYPMPVPIPIKGSSSTASGTSIQASSTPPSKSGLSSSAQPVSTSVEREPDNSGEPSTGKANTTLFDDERIYKKIHPKQGWPDNVLNLSIDSPEFKVVEGNISNINFNSEEFYPMSSELTRRALIICNRDYDDERYEDRKIADMDSYRLTEVLYGFNFNVTASANLTEEALMKQLEEEKTQNESAKNLSVFMLVISCYGGRGTIICSDGKQVNIQDIVNMFSAKSCPLMAGVPKLFIIQACGVKLKDNPQGMDFPENKDMKLVEESLASLQLDSPALMGNTADTRARLSSSSSQQSLSEPLTVGNNDDILVAMATTADVDHKDKQYSSMFLLGLSYMLSHHAQSEHFISLLEGINRLKQMDGSTEGMKLCEYKHSLTKTLVLMSGYPK